MDLEFSGAMLSINSFLFDLVQTEGDEIEVNKCQKGHFLLFIVQEHSSCTTPSPNKGMAEV